MIENRKIAAILAADVVGFSRLTGADEDRTLARLRALRSDLIDPTIAVHNGRVVKRTGDGALVEFRSVVDAVRCAVEIQNANGRAQCLACRRTGASSSASASTSATSSRRATATSFATASISPLAWRELRGPGAICLSEDAYRQVRARLDLAVHDLGQTTLKNIVEPGPVLYSLQRAARPTKTRRAGGGRREQYVPVQART